MGASISIDYISHRFNPSAPPTLKEIDAKIEPGEMIALIGRSCCGKSTLLHMLAGLLLPSEGCIRINGHQVTKPSAKWNMMFQKASLYPWMSVKDVKLYFGSWNEWSRDESLPIEEGLPYAS